MGKTKKQIKKDNIRYMKEQLDHCEDCKFFHASKCGNGGEVRYKNQPACYQFTVK